MIIDARFFFRYSEPLLQVEFNTYINYLYRLGTFLLLMEIGEFLFTMRLN